MSPFEIVSVQGIPEHLKGNEKKLIDWELEQQAKAAGRREAALIHQPTHPLKGSNEEHDHLDRGR